MDGGSSINILYADTLDHIGILRMGLYLGRAPFFGVIPRAQDTPLTSIWLPIMFGDPTNFRKEVLDFEVVDFASPNHALLGRPCYANFMDIPYYDYLKLKMPGPRGVIVVTSSVVETYR